MFFFAGKFSDFAQPYMTAFYPQWQWTEFLATIDKFCD